MPGHKGYNSSLGVESFDITEIDDADELWDASTIIAESEANASSLFGATTFYSAEGSSLCIRAMMFLMKKWAFINNKKPTILAGRNAHRTLIYSAAILDINIEWIMPKESDSYQMCSINAADIEEIISNSVENPVAVYVTSPDYLGNTLDIKSLSDVCHKHNIFLIVDNAHGAYLKFMNPSFHPMDLGADLCCDSAHKTLPALTGAAYLHISNKSDTLAGSVYNSFFLENTRFSMALFGSTSPSYLILQSLDLCNLYLYENKQSFEACAEKVKQLKVTLTDLGFSLCGDEPLKLTINARAIGYTGHEFSDLLKEKNILIEYHDEDYVVMMFTPMTSDSEFSILKDILIKIPFQTPLNATVYKADKICKALSPSQAILCESEIISSKDATGRILADTLVSTPPCVPLYMCGETINSPISSKEVKVIKK